MSSVIEQKSKGRASLTVAFRKVTSLGMLVTIATFLSLPAASRRSQSMRMVGVQALRRIDGVQLSPRIPGASPAAAVCAGTTSPD